MKRWIERPLARLLNPISPEEFQSQYFGQNHLFIPGEVGCAQDAQQLFSWDSLNRLLNKGSAHGLHVRIVQNSLNYLIQKDGQNFNEIIQKLREGGTLILEGVDRRDDQLAQFCDALSADIGVKTAVNLYLSCPGQAGYPLHYDTHDFFIIQIYGFKHWEIFPQTLLDPLLPDPSFSSPHHQAHSESLAPPSESERLAELTLSPGDILYVPRGYWHRAMAEREISLHLTVGLYLPTGLDLMHWLLKSLSEKPQFRKALPLTLKKDLPFAVGDSSPYQNDFDALKKDLLAELAGPDLLRQFHQDQWANLEHRQSFTLPHQYFQDAQELNSVQQFSVRKVPYLFSHQGERLELVYQHQKLYFAPQARDLLEYILSANHFSCADLQDRFPEFSWSVIQTLLLPLVQDGLIIPEG